MRINKARIFGLLLFILIGFNSQTVIASESEALPHTPLDGAQIRRPEVGQVWVYQVRNLYNNLIEDEITESVIQTAPNIKIERISKKYGTLTPEIQSATGMVLSDPYWSPAVNFSVSKPMWFDSMVNDQDYRSSYRVDEGSGFYSWSSHFKMLGNAIISVHGETYQTVKSKESIQFISSDFSQKNNIRVSVVWLVPSIGRWAMREVHGAYDDTNSGRGADRYESSLRYELTSWK